MDVSLVMVSVLSQFCTIYKSMDTESNSETRGAFEFHKEWYKLPLVSKLKLISVVSLAFKSGVNQVYFGTDEVQSQVQAVLASILFYHFGILS